MLVVNIQIRFYYYYFKQSRQCFPFPYWNLTTLLQEAPSASISEVMWWTGEAASSKKQLSSVWHLLLLLWVVFLPGHKLPRSRCTRIRHSERWHVGWREESKSDGPMCLAVPYEVHLKLSSGGLLKDETTFYVTAEWKWKRGDKI